MEYLKSRFTKKYRTTFFLFFVALFLTISPLVILYTAGYRYDFKFGIIKKTGAISVDIEPANAQVYLDGILIKSSMPVRLKNITPGEYEISIKQSGYYNWNKKIKVEEKQSVYIKDVALIQKNNPELISSGNKTDLQISYNNKYLTYIKNQDNFSEVILLNLNNNSEELLARLPEDKNLKIYWAPDNNYLIISQNDNENIIVLNANDTTKQIDIQSLEKEKIEKFVWKKGSTPELLYSTDSNLKSFRPDTQKDHTVSKNIFFDWTVEQNKLWVIEKNTSTEELVISSDVTAFKNQFAILPDLKNLLSIEEAREETVLLNLAENHYKLLNKNRAFEIEATDYLISKFNNWWLFWNEWEMQTYKNGEEPILLLRSGEGLQDVIPLDENNTLGLVWNEKISVLYPYYFVPIDLLEIKAKQAVADSENRILYILGEKDEENGLWKLEY